MKLKLKQYFLFFVIVISQNIIAQDKPHLYFNKDGKEIAKDDYCRRCEIQYFIPVEIENDSIIKHVIIPRQIMGVLNKKELMQVQQFIGNTVNRKIYKNHIIILNYFTTKNSNIKHYTNNKGYIKKCKKDETISQFFITEKDFKFTSRKTPIFEDITGNIARIFFQNSNINCSYVIIKPDGYYYTYLGEYPQDRIIDIAKSSWNASKNN
ncbi:hypothetical protein ULMS_21880 [Patiriisocius marinistellae]|uniref:Uncharacterized protein n=1 Tax=Patiriisocius marinistellae TaxID=2494560 RepID=A0A5J4FWU0_9FLAO|nr:hypothetical protein [Patiriisocius marinistellae]GEQ86680.1 hypothetical protein ULMS_21880 [Patiriisocius marinistellae]